jgi:hypothetical protein
MRTELIRDVSPEHVLCDSDELVQRVVASLQHRLGRQVRNFQLATLEQGLILRGTVNTHYGKQVVQEVVMQLSERAIVVNDIEVQPVSAADGDHRQS